MLGESRFATSLPGLDRMLEASDGDRSLQTSATGSDECPCASTRFDALRACRKASGSGRRALRNRSGRKARDEQEGITGTGGSHGMEPGWFCLVTCWQGYRYRMRASPEDWLSL